jgi:hypothetical protein
MSLPERTSVLVRFPPELLDRIRSWCVAETEAERPTIRHAAILELIELGLSVGVDPSLAAKAALRERLNRNGAAIMNKLEEILFE